MFKRVRILIGLVLVLTSMNANAQLRLPKYFTDHMILQREEKVKLWGWAKPGQNVTVALDKKNYNVTAAQDSTWSIELPKFKAGGPYLISIASENKKIKIEDVYFGDVWFCSGQSNMSFRVDQAKDYDKELKDADYPLIRELGVGLETSIYPQNDINNAVWKTANAKTIAGFSAVAWFFAKELYKKNNVPVGIIHSSWGGTPIEAFMSAQDLQDFPLAKKKIDQLSPEFINATNANNQKLIDACGIQNPKGFVNVKNLYPTLVYNAMIVPFFKFPVKGVLWYQGEANAHHPNCYSYEKLLTGLINSWRKSWGKEDLPFLLVQLANYNQKVTSVSRVSGWAVLQEAQYKVAQSLNNVDIVITNDIGNPFDAHPTNKQEVGKRLAAVALNNIYGNSAIVSNGPSLSTVKVVDDKMHLSFEGMGSGLISKDGNSFLRGFEVAGEDQQFHEAVAEISDNNVIVSAKDVSKPVFVRYAFKDNPPPVNFYNKEGFPAVPFRTDNLK